MILETAFQRTAILLSAALMLAACSSAQPVRDLSVSTGDRATSLAASMSALKTNAVDTARQRAATVAQLQATLAQLDSEWKAEEKEVAEYGGTALGGLYTQTDALIKDAADLPDNAFAFANTQAAKNTALIGSLGPVSDDGKNLIGVAEGLYALGQERSLRDRLKFLIGFGNQIRSEVEAREAELGKNAGAASSDAALQELKSFF